MPAYIVVDLEVLDAERYESYKLQVPPTLKSYEGRFIVRGGKVETLEGGWSPERLVILEFPSGEKARAWWNSPEYAKAKMLRQETARSRIILVEGV